MNVRRLDGRLLNYWVARSAGLTLAANGPLPRERHNPDSSFWHPHNYNPANDWSCAGGIVAGNWYDIDAKLTDWFGAGWSHVTDIADNPLKWFMRAFVATQWGDEVESVVTPSMLEAESYKSDPEVQMPDVGAKAKGKGSSGWFRLIGW